MSTLPQLVPDPTILTNLPPSELGAILLEILTGPKSPVQNGLVHIGSIVGQLVHQYDLRFNPELHQDASNAISSAWFWLRVNGLICPDTGANPNFDRITKRGYFVRDRNGVGQLLADELLPPDFLHPTLLQNARPLFLQGRFDTAVFEAFKELEVAVRTAGNYGPEKIGTALMSAAFNPLNGPLTDQALEPGERQALMNLMVGAIGSYKNPNSHRKVGITRDEAREMIVLASHLLKIVDSRASP